MVNALINKAYYLRARPQGSPAQADLQLVEEPVPSLQAGQALVRTCYLSVDPTTRVWMSDYPGYLPPAPLGAVMRALGVGQVVASQRPDLQAGALVFGWTGWQEFCVADDTALISPFVPLPEPLPAPLSAFVGVLGHTGITAFLGIDLARVLAGQTLVISGAAGAVGSIAGQLAKVRGARVVGIASGRAKCHHVVKDLGFDACVDRSAADWRERLAEALPDGVDVDFENVGGEVMDEVLMHLNLGARVVLCGMISGYDSLGTDAATGQKAIPQLLMRRASLHGFIVLDHGDRFQEAIEHLANLLDSGQLRYDETIVDGLEKAPDALNLIFTGANTGKVLVKVSEPQEL